MYNMIDSIIIDTSAFVAEQCDFIGMGSAMLPSLFSILDERKIDLLSHPILHEEIKKHISGSALLEKLANMKKAVVRYKDVLPLISLSADKVIGEIDSLDLEKKMTDTFEKFYQAATILPYPQPEVVFAQFFSHQPPFSETGDKKHEFPDAFVVEAIKQYLLSKPLASILVVSGDSDWEKALAEVPRVSFAQSISQGMKILQGSENIVPIYESVKGDIEKEVLWRAECECYELDTFEEVEDDLEITSIKVASISDDIIPLKITESSVLLRASATLKLAGHATVLDDSRSYWDKEDGCYLFVAYNNISFDDGEAEVEFEALITFDHDDSEDYIADGVLEMIKLNVKYNIEVEVDEDNIVYSDPKQDAQVDKMDTLEDYHRH